LVVEKYDYEFVKNILPHSGKIFPHGHLFKINIKRTVNNQNKMLHKLIESFREMPT